MDETVTLSDIRIASEGSSSTPQLVSHNNEDLSADKFLPFGETASLFDECYIGDNRVFAQRNSTITLSFKLTTGDKLVSMTAQQEHDDLRVIKRKPRAVVYDTAQTSPQRVSVEYFNGKGWRKLSCSDELSTLFDGTRTGHFTFKFSCPGDW